MRHNVQPTETARIRTAAATGDARPDAHLLRYDVPVDALQASQADEALRRVRTADRTHVIRLLDSPGASLRITCPAWCESDHYEDKTHGTFLEDFAHRGGEEALHVDLDGGAHEDVLICEITQYPFGRDLRQPTVVMWPTLGMSQAELDPDKLCALAGQLRDYARALDELIQRMEEAREQATEARRADHEGRWQA